MEPDIKKIQEEILRFIEQSPEQFEKVTRDIQAIIDTAMNHYDTRQEEIIQSVIHDPKDVPDPEDHVRILLADEQKKIHADLILQLERYQKDLKQSL